MRMNHYTYKFDIQGDTNQVAIVMQYANVIVSILC